MYLAFSALIFSKDMFDHTKAEFSSLWGNSINTRGLVLQDILSAGAIDVFSSKLPEPSTLDRLAFKSDVNLLDNK